MALLQQLKSFLTKQYLISTYKSFKYYSNDYKYLNRYQSKLQKSAKGAISNRFFLVISIIVFLQLSQPSISFADNRQLKTKHVKALNGNKSSKSNKNNISTKKTEQQANGKAKEFNKAVAKNNSKSKVTRVVSVVNINNKQRDVIKRRLIKPAVARKSIKSTRVIAVSQKSGQSKLKNSKKKPQIKSLVLNKNNSRLGHRVQIKTYAHASTSYTKPITRRVAFSPSSHKLNTQSKAYRSVIRRPAIPHTATYFNDQDNSGLPLRSNIAYVFDQNSRQALVDKNSEAVVPIASITKLMTAIVVLESGMPLDDVLMITNEDLDYEKWTKSRLAIGSRLTRNDMLHIALMASENRAASALSRYYVGGQAAFIKAMNQKAKSLGMTHTFFKNATGLSSQNISSAQDLVKLVEESYRFPLIREYSTDTAYTVNTGLTTLNYGSTNGLVKNSDWEIGIQKTGFINEAGECLVMQTMIDSKPIVIVLLDAAGKYSRIGDAKRLREWIVAGHNTQQNEFN